MTRQAGPELHRKLNSARALHDGQQIWQLHHRDGHSLRAIAHTMGMSPTTCWRRYWLYADATLPLLHGNPISFPLPPQRGTE